MITEDTASDRVRKMCAWRRISLFGVICILICSGVYSLWFGVAGTGFRELDGQEIDRRDLAAHEAEVRANFNSGESRSALPGGGQVPAANAALDGGIVVTVVWADEQVASGIAGAIYPLGAGAHAVVKPTRFVTDELGVARIPATDGEWVLRVSADPSGWRKCAVVGPEPTRVRYVVPPGTIVRGVVVDTLDRPVVGASISVTSTMSRGARLPVTHTAGDGRFLFRMGGKTGIVVASAVGFAPGVANIWGTQGEAMDLRLVLRKGSRVYGVVRDILGSPVSDCSVVVASQVAAGSRVGWAPDAVAGKTSDQGRFEIVDVAAGVVSVDVRHPRFLAWSTTVEVNEARSTECIVELRSPTALRGTVRSESGDPIADAQVCCIVAGDGAYECVTGVGGGFEIQGIPVGKAKGWVRHHRHGWGRFVCQISPGDPSGIEIVLSPGVDVYGTVVDEKQWALPSVLGEVAFVDPRGGVLQWRDKLSGDDMGRFSIGKVDPRLELVISASKDGYESQSKRCTPGGQIVLILPRRRIDTFVKGRVINVLGHPEPGVLVMPVGFGEVQSPSATTNSEGRFALTVGIPRGPFEIVLRKSGLARTSLGMFRASGGATDVGDLQIGRGGRVRLRVNVPEGRPVSVTAALVDSESGRSVQAFLVRNGVGESGDVPPGVYLLSVSPYRFQTSQETVRIAVGQVASVTMDMRPGRGMFIDFVPPPGELPEAPVRVLLREKQRTVTKTWVSMWQGKYRMYVSVGDDMLHVEAAVGGLRAQQQFFRTEVPRTKLLQVLTIQLRNGK